MDFSMVCFYCGSLWRYTDPNSYAYANTNTNPNTNPNTDFIHVQPIQGRHDWI